jgi:hypothetical protein
MKGLYIGQVAYFRSLRLELYTALLYTPSCEARLEVTLCASASSYVRYALKSSARMLRTASVMPFIVGCQLYTSSLSICISSCSICRRRWVGKLRVQTAVERIAKGLYQQKVYIKFRARMIREQQTNGLGSFGVRSPRPSLVKPKVTAASRPSAWMCASSTA